MTSQRYIEIDETDEVDNSPSQAQSQTLNFRPSQQLSRQLGAMEAQSRIFELRFLL
jgi:hypothetical protein